MDGVSCLHMASLAAQLFLDRHLVVYPVPRASGRSRLHFTMVSHRCYGLVPMDLYHGQRVAELLAGGIQSWQPGSMHGTAQR